MYASFTSVAQIKKQKAYLITLIAQAVQNERDGRRVAFKKIEEHAVPIELQTVLDARPDVRAAFTALTPGRQRGYLMHIGGAKQHATRCARVEACIPTILAGRGSTADRYIYEFNRTHPPCCTREHTTHGAANGRCAHTRLYSRV